MSFARVHSAQTNGLEAHPITIEIDLSGGLHAFSIVGLPDKAVEESRDRMSAAIKNADFKKFDPQFRPPKSYNRKITVSLAPADLKKEGPLFDLPIAIAYLIAIEEVPIAQKGKLFIGELSLDGTLRKVQGMLPLVQCAKKAAFQEVFVPADNAQEAALVDGITVYAANTLSDVVEHLRGEHEQKQQLPPVAKAPHIHNGIQPKTYLEDIRGQEHAKRGLIIAASGGHNIALYGPPGTGKTMLAQALAGILPSLSEDESLEVTGIHSVAGHLSEPLLTSPPIRSPHHTASYVSVVGGGTFPKPGEVTLAHRGVLFLDEFPEFDRRVINALRQPLEDGLVSIARAKGNAVFPSEFILIAAMNPCPCGYFGTSKCACTAATLQRYRQKISGPILDRIDMWIEMGAIDHEKLSAKRIRTNESQEARDTVQKAREKQLQRFQKKGRLNAGMSSKGLEHHVPLSPSVSHILNTAAAKMDLSPRAYHRVIKLARTIADIDESRTVEEPHVLEALQYRPKQNL